MTTTMMMLLLIAITCSIGTAAPAAAFTIVSQPQHKLEQQPKLSLSKYLSKMNRIASSSRTITTTTQLAFGIPSFMTPPSPPPNDNNNSNKKKSVSKNSKKQDTTTSSSSDTPKQVGVMGLVQLIMAGAGAPFLGDFDRVEEGTGKLLFTLEANNFVDENGNSKQTAAPYFENGWIDPIDLQKEQDRKNNKNKNGGFKLW